MSDIFISIELENHIIIGHRILFALSTFVNSIATFCLLKQTPEMQSEIKVYLYYMQALTFASDFLLDFAVEPFTLLPVLGGYCKGFACKWIDIRFSMLLTFLILYNIGFCMVACVFRRHQSLATERFKFGKIANRLFIMFFFFLNCTPTIYGWFTNFDDTDSEMLIEFHNLTWMADRGPNVVYKRTPNITIALPALLYLVIFLNSITGIAIITHMMWEINRGTKRSRVSRKRISRALLVLSIQVGLPIFLVSVPACIFIHCLIDESVYPFGTCYATVSMVNAHSIFHSVLLLAITPAYRQFIAHFCCRICGRRNGRKLIIVMTTPNSVADLGRRFTFPK